MKEPTKITIIDDNKDLVAILRQFLEERGFSVSFAYDGRRGLELVRKKKPDLVILDIVMPETDGRDVLIELRKNEDTKDIPIIMLTVRTEPFDRDYGLELGADVYLPKPYDGYLLLKHIEIVLEKRKKEQ